MPSLVYIGPMNLEKKILSMHFCYFIIMITLEKGVALNLNKLESPTPKVAFEIGPVVLEKKMKM